MKTVYAPDSLPAYLDAALVWANLNPLAFFAAAVAFLAMVTARGAMR